MSVRTLAQKQPASFAFKAEYMERANRVIAKYPKGRQASAVIPLLDLAQRQEGWVSRPAIEEIAKILGMAPIRVLEVATFYTMFSLHPVGRHHVQVCTNLPCQLRGSDAVVKACREKLGCELGETTADGQFTLAEVECSGACVNAPVVQIGDEYFEDVDAASMGKIIDALKRGEKLAHGPQNGRLHSAPAGQRTSLNDAPTPPPKQDLAAAKAAYDKAKAEAAAKAAAPKT
ncbi:MAG: NADH-quinone oxidoreductase subunit NuoE [Alphaproteobacteria bacterium]|nr:NADH-quinone oxidoreductase subunit NuoE [Alphaproteobacteria bacterium]